MPRKSRIDTPGALHHIIARVKALRKTGAYQKGDERILGGSTFVQEVLSQANERMEQKYRLAAEGF